MPLSFKARLSADRPLLGTVVTLPSPEIVEMCVAAGFDWLFLDMEHTTLEVADIQRLAQAAGDCPCLVRIPAHEAVWIKRVLDTGVAGLIIPQVNTPEQAAWAVRQAKYPPKGVRSVGAARAHRYGLGFNDYVQHADDQLALVVQAEHIEAVRNIEAILEVPGVDAVFVGPFDLSASLGKPGQIDDPEVVQAISVVKAACARRHTPISIFCPTQAAAHQALEAGYDFPAVGTDVGMLLGLYRETVVSLGVGNRE